jgi:hypothetical protein
LTFHINITHCKSNLNEEPRQSNHAIYNHRHNRAACPILGVLGGVDFHVGAHGRRSGRASVSPPNGGSDSSGNHGRGALALPARGLVRNLGTNSRHRRCMRNYRGRNPRNFDRIDFARGRPGQVRASASLDCNRPTRRRCAAGDYYHLHVGGEIRLVAQAENSAALGNNAYRTGSHAALGLT